MVRFAGWCACLSGSLSIISGIFFVLFYALEVPRMSTPDAPQTFGTLNDIATLFQFLCQLPVTLALHRLAPPNRRGRINLACAHERLTPGMDGLWWRTSTRPQA